ncbi:MAG: hypothetical protein IPM11_09045 [Micropruina sp.]|nr:hypothetical protein [Micropruina sp.]
MYTVSYLVDLDHLRGGASLSPTVRRLRPAAANRPFGIAWTAISIAPFTLAILRYAMRTMLRGGRPGRVVIHYRMLQALGLLWVVTLSVPSFFTEADAATQSQSNFRKRKNKPTVPR